MFRQSGTFREDQEVEDRVMDSMDLERERGITIAAKNCSIHWKDTKINILDTPGHADFGGEVERALMMVNGVVLLVDASEGPLPQTRFVLKKALEQRLKIIVVVNKIDRKDARPQEVLNEVYDLFIDLDANEEQIDFQVLYAVGREGIAFKSLPVAKGGEGGYSFDGSQKNDKADLSVLFDTIIEEIPGPTYDPAEPFQMLVADLDYSDYLGRLAIGRVVNGSVKKGEELVRIDEEGAVKSLKVSRIDVYDGLKFQEVDNVEPGDIMILAGIEEVHIGDTICTKESPKALKRIMVDEPTISMMFSINTSPLAGREGKLVQSNKIKERLFKETLRNVALKVEDSTYVSEEVHTDSHGNPADSPFSHLADYYIVKGRGEFQMAILIETMRREGFELSVGRPQVIYKRKNGKLLEPIEHLFIDCEEEFIGVISEKLSRRKGIMVNLVNHGTGRVRIEFTIPSRSLIGYRNEFLTDTKGTGLMNSYLQGYEDYRGDFQTRLTGSLVSDRLGEALPYALFNLEPRGTLFVMPNDPVYEGMIVGEHNRDNDLDVNPTKGKKLSNMRASGKDDSVTLTPVTPMTLERAIEYIKDDEMIEVTPKSIRLRKIILSSQKRHTLRGKALAV
jgi:GTP-binding protein